ncbi:MAG: hypothetical protein WC620_11660, partial [Methanoregula sp.]
YNSLYISGLFETGGAGTSTIAGNLDIQGTLESAKSYTGDLYFANMFRFTEGDLASSTQSLLLNNQNNQNLLTILDDGKVGIGTSSPTHTLEVNGDIGATAFVNLSSKEYKDNITYLNNEDEDEILQKISETNVATYTYKSDTDINTDCHADDTDAANPPQPSFEKGGGSSLLQREDGSFDSESLRSSDSENLRFDELDERDLLCSPRLGLIAEEAPKEILSVDGKGVDLYKMTSFVFAGMKAQQREIDLMKEDIADIKLQLNGEGGVGENPPQPSLKGGSLLAAMMNWMADKILSAKEFVAEVITAKKVKTNYFEMQDSATGEIWCVKIENGEFVKTKGECSVSDPNPSTSSGSGDDTNPVEAGHPNDPNGNENNQIPNGNNQINDANAENNQDANNTTNSENIQLPNDNNQINSLPAGDLPKGDNNQNPNEENINNQADGDTEIQEGLDSGFPNQGSGQAPAGMTESESGMTEEDGIQDEGNQINSDIQNSNNQENNFDAAISEPAAGGEVITPEQAPIENSAE